MLIHDYSSTSKDSIVALKAHLCGEFDMKCQVFLVRYSRCQYFETKKARKGCIIQKVMLNRLYAVLICRSYWLQPVFRSISGE